MYKILQNKDNDLVLIIEPQDCDPDGPMFIYDGGDTALLFRDWTSNVRLNDIGLDARSELTKADLIYVIEMADGEVAREYAAPIRHVRDVKSLMGRV